MLPQPATACEDLATVESGKVELEKYAPELRYVARYICRDDAERDDLIQDTFVRALRHLSHHPPPANMAAWLVSILRNAYIDMKRRPSREFELLIEDTPTPEPEPEPPWGDISIDDVCKALCELRPALRESFKRHYFAGQRYKDIAQEFGISPNTVATQLLRARKRLREILLRDRVKLRSVR